MKKYWVSVALELLKQGLEPVPHEINELDWKTALSRDRERLTEHLIAFANLSNGGFLVYGIRDPDAALQGVTSEEVSEIVNTLANLGRDAVEPPIVIDNAVVEYSDTPILFVHIPGQSNKPVHRRGKSIEEAWVRSGGTTRKASRQEIGSLMINSRTPRWEEIRASGLFSAATVADMLDMKTIASLLQRPLPSSEAELFSWLIDESVVSPDGNGYYITNFGAIAAAHRLEQFDQLKRKRVRVIRYSGTNKVDTIDELMGQRAMLSASRV